MSGKDKEKESKQNETSLVKIDSELYEKVKKKVKGNPILYPSIKNFVETAVMQLMEHGKMNITDPMMGELFNFDDLLGKNPKIIKNTKNFTLCLSCGRPFLKEKSDKSEESRICPNCKKIIKHFKDKV